MKKREQGILTVEASIVLTLCTFVILFLFSFARVYTAQSLVSHAVLQASDAVALESYLRETALNGSETDVVDLANRLTKSTSISADNFTSLRSADVPKIAKEKFIYAISNSESQTDEKLRTLGVKDGISGIDFSSSRIELGNDDVIVYINYTIEMQFPVFGMSEINASKAAKSKTFGDILFGIQTIADDPHMGSASGGGNYRYGTQVQISATPNYGYKFKGWTDGSTENPRMVTVTGPKTYIAVFEASEFGINVEASPSSAGTVSGGGAYTYLSQATITASPNEGYHFTRWSLYKHTDMATSTIDTAAVSLTVDQTYTCTAYFEPNVYNVSVKTSGVTGNAAYIVYNGSNKTSISAKYLESFKLSAPTVSGYKFLGWKEEGTSSYFSTNPTVTLTVPAKDVTYVACYESLIKTVKFYGYNGVLYATKTVYAGSSLGSSMPANPKSVGRIFNGWTGGFTRNTIVNNNMDVYSNWKTCSSHIPGDCGVVHTIRTTKLNSHSSPGSTYQCMCIVCADCGSYLTKSGNKYIATNGRNWNDGNGSYIYISPSVWCIKHKNPSGDCSSFKNRNSNGTYRVHEL